jgi:hypothetical protein
MRKRCCRCHQIKDGKEFYASSRTKDKKQTWCRECALVHARSKSSTYLANQQKLERIRSTGEKSCTTCGVFKTLDDFGIRKDRLGGRKSSCILCERDRSLKYDQQKREQRNAAAKRIRQTAQGKVQHVKDSKLYRKRHPDRVCKTGRAHYHKVGKYDPKLRIKNTIGSRIRKSLRNGGKGGRHWETVVGYTFEQLVKRLETKFYPNPDTGEAMSLKNYGLHGWHIDHIIPIKAFDIQSIHDESFKKCWSLDNLQPLWAQDNLKKAAKHWER